MVFCAVVGCSNNSNRKSKDYNSECRFFTFPKDHLCNEWVLRTGRKCTFNLNTARICSDHFLDSDFMPKEKILNMPRNKWKLKPKVVPTVDVAKGGFSATTLPSEQDGCIERVEGCHAEIKSENFAKSKLIKAEEIEVFIHEDEHQEAPAQRFAKKEDSRISVGSQTDGLQENLSRKLNELQCKYDQAVKTVLKQAWELNAVRKLFSETQLRALQSGRRVTWTAEDIASAKSLHAAGPRCYRLLKERGYPLPGTSTLRQWARKNCVQSDA